MPEESKPLKAQLLRFREALIFHALPLLVLLVLASLATALAWNVGFEQRWTSDTTDTFYRIMRSTPADAEHGRALLPTMLGEVQRAFYGTPAAGWYQAVFDAYLRSFYLAWDDIAMAYKLAVFPLLAIFSLTAYGFFWSLTRRRWVALALTVAALAPMPLAWAGERAGFGPIWNYTRRYFLSAWIPAITWFFYRGMLNNKKLLLVAVAAAGLASNLHASGIILIEIFALTWLVYGRINFKRISLAAALVLLGLLFSVTSISSIWAQGLEKISQLMLAGMSGDALAAAGSVFPFGRERIPPELSYLFYPPRIYSHLSPVLVDFWLLLALVLSVLPLVLRRGGNGESRIALFAGSAMCLLFVSFEQMWPWVMLGGALYFAGRRAEPAHPYVLACYLVIATFWVAVVGMLVFQLAYQSVEGFPLVFNQLRGIRFMGFWVFVWIAALAIPLLNKGVLIEKRVLKLILLAICVAGFFTLKGFYRQNFDSQDQAYTERKIALLDIARWAKSNTPPGSLFMAGSSAFAIVADRLVLHTDKEVRNESIDWLPPKGLLPPAKGLEVARREQAAYFFLDPADVPEGFSTCVRRNNQYFALLETACVVKN